MSTWSSWSRMARVDALPVLLERDDGFTRPLLTSARTCGRGRRASFGTGGRRTSHEQGRRSLGSYCVASRVGNCPVALLGQHCFDLGQGRASRLVARLLGRYNPVKVPPIGIGRLSPRRSGRECDAEF